MRRFERVDVPRARDAVLPKRATAHSAIHQLESHSILRLMWVQRNGC